MIKKTAILILFIFFLAPSAFADQDELYSDILFWLKTKSQAANYDIIREELLFLFNQAKANNLPLEVMFNRLKEAASKKIQANQVFRVLSKELKDLQNIDEIIKEYNPCLAPLDESESLQGIPQSRIHRERITLLLYYLKSGIPNETLNSTLIIACEVQKSYQQVFDLLNAFLTITALHSLSADELSELCEAVLRSKLTSDSYPSIAAFFLKGHSSRINVTVIQNVIIKVLNEGGNLINIENELFRRGSSR